jgi:transposase
VQKGADIRARAFGHRQRGKPSKLSPNQETHLVGLYRAGQHTTAELAELFSVGRSTVYRAVQRAGDLVPPEHGRRTLRIGAGDSTVTQR